MQVFVVSYCEFGYSGSSTDLLGVYASEEAANAFIEDEKLFQQYLTETCSKVTEEFPPITYDYTKYKDPHEYMELMREIDAKRLAKQKQLLLELFPWRKEEIEGLVHCDRSYTDAGDYYIESFELKG